ncbi:MAG TPA: SDR family oxidoreductase [Acidimicrobiia bacterium]|jgi:NAD(P)-dependent dehydrogenase (short-subunit alcohol dehydrogenase family)|nr:SDR family oxidoreductase [Acidimicrobiia bacterium]
MGTLDGRVAIITGAGRGIGREHALFFAAEGARVVVNDLGGDIHGEGADRAPAQQVVDEIKGLGGEAVANTESASDFEGAKRLIDQAVETFGDLHVLVNNAGILRDRVLVNMTEPEWDAVINVHLKGHFCPTRHAAAYWRERTKAGHEVRASIVHTSSTSGVLGNAGQTNYGAAKAGIAAFSTICAMELGRYGVRSNAVTPMARTRLTEQTPGLEDVVRAPADAGVFDVWDPANISPMIAYLGTADCPFTGETFLVQGDTVARYQPYIIAETISNRGRRWTVPRLIEEGPKLAAGDDRRGGPSELGRVSR